MMILIIVGLCLWGWGWVRTLVIYIAVIASAVTLVFAEFVGAALSYIFFTESVRAFHGSGYMISWFVERPGFEFWQAPIAPVLFFFDLIVKGFEFCWQCPNIFSIGLFGFWWYMMFQVWGVVVFKTLFPSNLTLIDRHGRAIR